METDRLQFVEIKPLGLADRGAVFILKVNWREFERILVFCFPLPQEFTLRFRKWHLEWQLIGGNNVRRRLDLGGYSNIKRID